ncbi:MAG: hypothetical protein H0V56_08360 [Chthoniobacterales bacterium]|nr:hypothetical protein [Chthoniobacterales bacterium]
MTRKPNVLWAVSMGLAFMLLQLFAAVVLLAPEGPLSYRYTTLIQHDSYWFANIIERGYDTIVPPITHKMMEVSNVAFFPAYPAIAGALHHWTGLSVYTALLVTAQAAAWGFWSYFFLFCERWNISPLAQVLGAIAVFAHPTAFFLVAGYSESLFMMALLGFIYWSTARGRTAMVLAGVHGFGMSATRIVGLPCAAIPVMRAFFEGGWKGVKNVRGWFAQYAKPVALMFAAMLGGISFFIYCLVRWGRWDLYMLTQEAGWAVYPDYLAVFKLESYRWLVPPMNDPTQWSQMTMTVGALILIGVAICELLPALRRATAWPSRIGFYFAAVITYYIAVSGVASVNMESMLRYQFCAHAVIVLALLHFLAEFRRPPALLRAIGMAGVILLSAAGIGLQGWWIWNFTRGDWVA